MTEPELESLLSELRRLRDHEEIRHLLYRYARGVDRGNLPLLQSVYHSDGTDRHGFFDGPGDEYAKRLVEAEAHLARTGNHHITNVLIELDGDEACCETYFLAFHPHEDTGAPALGVTSGRYLDRLARRNGRWAIVRREVVNDWTRLDFAGQPWPRASVSEGGFLPGARGRADPSSGFFRQFPLSD
jgi:hypothetical protein